MTRLLLACLVATLTTSCAKKPMPVVEAQPGQVLAYGQPPAPEYGQLTIVRDAGFIGGGCAMEQASIDLGLPSSELSSFSLAPGSERQGAFPQSL